MTAPTPRGVARGDLVDCDTCEHEAMCRENIWDASFTPPCFVGVDDEREEE